MNRDSVRKSQSLNENIEKVEEVTVIIVPGAKIHRANILARIVHSISLYKTEWALEKIKIVAANRAKRHKKLGLAINRIFRRNFHEAKFHVMQKIKK